MNLFEKIKSAKIAISKAFGKDPLVKYYEDTLLIIKKTNAELANMDELQIKRAESEEPFVEYYKGVLRILKEWNSILKSASTNIWDERFKKLKMSIDHLERNYKSKHKELASRPQVGEEVRSELRMLRQEIEEELKKLQAAGRGLLNISNQFTGEQYLERSEAMELLDRLEQLNIDVLLFQWIVNV